MNQSQKTFQSTTGASIHQFKHLTHWPIHMRAPWPHTRLDRDFSLGSMLPRNQRLGWKLSGSGNKAGSRNIPNRLACTWLCTHQCSVLYHSQRPNPRRDPLVPSPPLAEGPSRWDKLTGTRHNCLKEPEDYLTPNPTGSKEKRKQCLSTWSSPSLL